MLWFRVRMMDVELWTVLYWRLLILFLIRFQPVLNLRFHYRFFPPYRLPTAKFPDCPETPWYLIYIRKIIEKYRNVRVLYDKHTVYFQLWVSNITHFLQHCLPTYIVIIRGIMVSGGDIFNWEDTIIISFFLCIHIISLNLLESYTTYFKI